MEIVTANIICETESFTSLYRIISLFVQFVLMEDKINLDLVSHVRLFLSSMYILKVDF